MIRGRFSFGTGAKGWPEGQAQTKDTLDLDPAQLGLAGTSAVLFDFEGEAPWGQTAPTGVSGRSLLLKSLRMCVSAGAWSNMAFSVAPASVGAIAASTKL
jgi:hypothetical protein